jgi:hypothetical protein
MASGQRLSWWLLGGLEDSPDVFCGVAELAARDAGTKVKLADSYAVVFDVVGEVIVALGHGSNEDCYALVVLKSGDVVAYAHNFCIEAEGDLAAVRREMVGDGVLDDLDELFLGGHGADLVFME